VNLCLKKFSALGAGGFTAVLTLEHFNAVLASVVGLLTIAGLIPSALQRWKRFLRECREKDTPPSK